MVTQVSPLTLTLLCGLGMATPGISHAAMPTPVDGQITDAATQVNVKQANATVVADDINDAASDREQKRAEARARARALQPIQTLSPPGWQAKPPSWEAAERARQQFIQRQQQLMQQRTQQFESAYRYLNRHAPTWVQPFYPPGPVPQQMPPIPQTGQ